MLAVLAACVVPASAVKPLEDFEAYPGFGFRVMQDAAQWRDRSEAIRMSFTTDSVTGRSALKLSFPDVAGAPGWAVRTELARTFAGQAGVSFWVKGDGSQNLGVVRLGTDGPAATFPLAEARWRRVIIPWQDFQPPAAAPAALAFGLDSNADRPAYYVIDKVEAVELALPAAEDPALAAVANAARPAADPELPRSLRTFTADTDFVAEVRNRLAARGPVTILVLGDAVGLGENLTYVGSDEKDRVLRKYPAVLGGLLAERFGYPADANVEKTRKDNGVEVTAFGPLRIVNVSEDIPASRAAAPLDRALTAHLPDLVILQLGNPDSVTGTPMSLRRGLSDCLDLLQRQKRPCIVVTNLPGIYRTAQEEMFAREIVTLAHRQSAALADTRKCFLSLGSSAWGVYFTDRHLPNHMGHRLIAQVLAAVFE